MGAPKKKYAHKPLPSPALLLREYQQPGANWTKMGEKYGWHAGVITRIVRAEAERQGLDWPLRSLSERNSRHDSVDATLTRKTLHDLRTRYRLSLTTVARQVGLNETIVRVIGSGRKTRIERRTQALILEFAARLDAGEVELPAERVHIRGADECPQGHKYTGKVDSRGYRVCIVCRANKARRQAPANRERNRAYKAALREKYRDQAA